MTMISLIQLIVAICLIVAILLQQRSSGLGMSFGGGGADSSYYTRRGFEKFLTQATSALAIAFVIVSIAQMFV